MVLVRLPHAALRARISLSTLLRAARGGRAPSPAILAAFELCPDERRFVDELSRRHRRFWIYRANQRRCCGDFAVVDMSSPKPARRRVWIIDLKLGGRLVVGGGGAGIQLSKRELAVRDLARRGVADAGSAAEAVVGDRAVVLAHIA